MVCVAVFQASYCARSYIVVQLLLGRFCCGINMHKWQSRGTEVLVTVIT